MNNNKQEDMKKLVDIIEDLVINSGWEISEIVELTPEDIFDNFEITVTGIRRNYKYRDK